MCVHPDCIKDNKYARSLCTNMHIGVTTEAHKKTFIFQAFKVADETRHCKLTGKKLRL